MGERITDKLVKSLSPPEKGNRVVYDTEVTGFGIRVTAKGSKSFVLRYVFIDSAAEITRKTHEYNHTIGSYPAWSVSAAREEAKDWRRKIDRGETHPQAGRRDKRAADKTRREAETYREAVEEYIRREQIGVRGNTTASEVKRRLLTDAPQWLDIPLGEISAEQILTHLELLRDGDLTESPPLRPRPYLANRFYAYLKTFYSWCAQTGIKKVPESVMIGMPRPWNGEEERDRFFNDEELKKLWNASEKLAPVRSGYLKTAILTGKRRTAIATMKWEDIDHNWFWKPPKPPKKKKNKRLHPIPFPSLLAQSLEPLRPQNGELEGSPYVFPGKRPGSCFHPGSKFQDDVKAASGIGDFFLHALRHTVETRMAELGVQPHIRDILLDHAPARGSGAGYDHHHYRDEMLAALEMWASHIQSIVKLD